MYLSLRTPPKTDRHCLHMEQSWLSFLCKRSYAVPSPNGSTNRADFSWNLTLAPPFLLAYLLQIGQSDNKLHKGVYLES